MHRRITTLPYSQLSRSINSLPLAGFTLTGKEAVLTRLTYVAVKWCDVARRADRDCLCSSLWRTDRLTGRQRNAAGRTWSDTPVNIVSRVRPTRDGDRLAMGAAGPVLRITSCFPFTLLE